MNIWNSISHLTEWASDTYGTVRLLVNPPAIPVDTTVQAGLESKYKTAFEALFNENFLNNLPLDHFAAALQQGQKQLLVDSIFLSLMQWVSANALPLYRIEDAIEYALEKLPPGIADSLKDPLTHRTSDFQKKLRSNPDFVKAALKQSLSRIETSYSAFNRAYAKEHWGYDFMGDLLGFGMKTAFTNYLSQYFSPVEFLISDECQRCLAFYLDLLPLEDQIQILKELHSYTQHLYNDLYRHVPTKFLAEPCINAVFAKLKGFKQKLEHEIQQLESDPQIQSAKIDSTPMLTAVASGVITGISTLSAQVQKRPMASLWFALITTQALVAPVMGQRVSSERRSVDHGRALAASIISATVNVGETYLSNLHQVFGCNQLINSTTMFACPFTGLVVQEYTNQGYYNQNPSFLGFKTVAINGTYALTYTGIIPQYARFGYTVNIGGATYLCPANFSNYNQCTQNINGFNGIYNIFVLNRPPRVPYDNTTVLYDGYLPGTHPITLTSTAFRVSPYLNTPTDDDIDVLKYKTHFDHRLNTLQVFPQWMTTDSGTGEISGYVPVGEQGIYQLAQTITDPYNGNTILNQGFVTTVHYSNITVPFTLNAPNHPPTNIKKPAEMKAYSFTTMNVALPITAYFNDVDLDAMVITTIYAQDNSSTTTMSYDMSEQAVIWETPNPELRGTYSIRLKACDIPSTKCIPPGCTPHASACTSTEAFDVALLNSPPTRTPNTLMPSSSTTIGSMVRLSNVRAKFKDLDLDTLTFTISSEEGDLPEGVSAYDSVKDEFTWLPTPGTETGKNYLYRITANDGHGGETSDVWTVTLTDRPAQIKSNLPNTLATVGMQSLGNTHYPFPFSDPDLRADQLSELVNQTNIKIPEAIAPFTHVTWNSLTGQYDISWDSIPGHAGTWSIVFTHTNPINGQQTATQTNLIISNAGPQQLAQPVLYTGRVGSTVDFDVRPFFSHLDTDTTLTFSVNALPNGLSMTGGRIIGTVQPKTAGTYSLQMTVVDGYGKVLTPAPSLALSIERSAPTILPTQTQTVAINPNSFEPEQTGQLTADNPDRYNDLIFTKTTNTPVLTVNTDGTFSINPQNGQQGNYTAGLSITNGVNTTRTTMEIIIPRALPTFTPVDPITAHIGELIQKSLCGSNILDSDNPGSCSNFETSWNVPLKLSQVNALRTTGTDISITAPTGSAVQGNYTSVLTLKDKFSGALFTLPVDIHFQNQHLAAENGVTQQVASQNNEQTFVLSYPKPVDPDGDVITLENIENIPPGCDRLDAQKQLSCKDIHPGLYEIKFRFKDPSGDKLDLFIKLNISKVSHTPWYIERLKDALPGILGSILVFTAPVFWRHRKNKRKDKALSRVNAPLPSLLTAITQVHQLAPSKNTHPGLVDSSTIETKEELKTPTNSLRSLDKHSPSHARARSMMRVTGVSEPKTTVSNSETETERLMSEITEGATSLKDCLNKLNDTRQSLNNLKEAAEQYCKQLDECACGGIPDFVANTRIWEILMQLSSKLNTSLTATGNSGISAPSSVAITDKTMAMVHWAKELYVRYIYYVAGNQTGPSIRINLKRMLIQSFTELVKLARNEMMNRHDHNHYHDHLKYFYKELEFLRALLTLLVDEEKAGFWRASPLPCIRRPDRGPASIPDDALIAKPWGVYALMINELVTAAQLNLDALTLLNEISRAAHYRKPWCGSSRFEFTSSVAKDVLLEPIRSKKGLGEVNYWMADAVLKILAHWNEPATLLSSIENLDSEPYMRLLINMSVGLFNASFHDQMGAEAFTKILFPQLINNVSKLLKKLNIDLACRCLFSTAQTQKSYEFNKILSAFYRECSGYNQAIFIKKVNKALTSQKPMPGLRHWSESHADQIEALKTLKKQTSHRSRKSLRSSTSYRVKLTKRQQKVTGVSSNQTAIVAWGESKTQPPATPKNMMTNPMFASKLTVTPEAKTSAYPQITTRKNSGDSVGADHSEHSGNSGESTLSSGSSTDIGHSEIRTGKGRETLVTRIQESRKKTTAVFEPSSMTDRPHDEVGASTGLTDLTPTTVGLVY